MFTVISRPYDDKEIVEVYIADCVAKDNDDFEVEWLQARGKLLKNNPKYEVSDIIEALERKGWQIILSRSASVLY